MLAGELSEILEAYVQTSISKGDATVAVSGYAPDQNVSQIAARLAYAAILGINAVPNDTTPTDSSPAVEGAEVEPVEAAYGDACFNCGEEVDDTAIFCPTCGDPIANSEGNTKDTVESETPLDKETQEAEMADQITEAPVAATTEPAAAVAETAPAAAAVVETAPEAPARTLTDGDTSAIANAFAAAINPVLAGLTEAVTSLKPAPVTEAAPAAAPVAEATPAAEPAAEAPAVDESNKTYTFEEVQAIAADAAKTASEAAASAAVDQFRAAGAGRKGLVDTSQAAGVIEASDELDARTLAAMGNDEFYRAIGPVWESQGHNFTSFPAVTPA